MSLLAFAPFESFFVEFSGAIGHTSRQTGVRVLSAFVWRGGSGDGDGWDDGLRRQ